MANKYIVQLENIRIGIPLHKYESILTLIQYASKGADEEFRNYFKEKLKEVGEEAKERDHWNSVWNII